MSETTNSPNERWKNYCSSVPQKPGVYQFLDQREVILYVGKARDLRKRLSSWLLRPVITSAKHQALLSRLSKVNFITTVNEIEALLLENNLIKQHQPTYNVLLKDHKSYPYIRINDQHEFPGVYFYRGVRKKTNQYFGPWPDSRSVRKVLKLIHRLFGIRQCSDAFFNSRSRPCLQYQIGNCSAPCVGLIDRQHYQENVRQCRLFLRGKHKKIIAKLTEDMGEYARTTRYEEAAACRDRINAIRVINTEQIAVNDQQNVDVIAVSDSEQNTLVAQVLSIRGGINLGTVAQEMNGRLTPDSAELTRTFVMQFYRRREPPELLVTEQTIEDATEISQMLARYHPDLGYQVTIRSGQKNRTRYERWLNMVRENLMEKIATLSLRSSIYQQALKQLTDYLPTRDIQRIDCMDVSHLMGQDTVCSNVSCHTTGLNRKLYRLFNLNPSVAGDDLAAIAMALERKLKSTNLEKDGLPDVLLIDGGVNQWEAAHRVLTTIGLHRQIHLLAISKHLNRRLGMEYIHFDSKRWIAVRQLPRPLFRCLLTLRNEAHRFAVSAHRARRAKRTLDSQLDGIPLVGAHRKHSLLRYFRDPSAVQTASVAELCKIPGISKGVAERIYSHFHVKNDARQTAG